MIGEAVFEQLMLRMASSDDVRRIFVTWFESRSAQTTCGLCGSSFRVIDLPDWVYFGSGGCDVCCLGCPVVERPIKKHIPELIRGFIDACGFLPPSSAEPLNYAFTSRLRNSLHWLEVFRAFARMGGIKHASRKLGGSWFKALALSNLLPEGVLATGMGIRCLAHDGHECNSLNEQRIDDWLTAMGIPHEKEPHYPVHPDFNPRGRWRADWRVNDIFIEYFGLTGEESYDQKAERKIDLAAALGLRLVVIYPEHLQDLDGKLTLLCSRE